MFKDSVDDIPQIILFPIRYCCCHRFNDFNRRRARMYPGYQKFSCAVSGVGYICLYRRSCLRPSAEQSSYNARKTSGTQDTLTFEQ